MEINCSLLVTILESLGLPTDQMMIDNVIFLLPPKRRCEISAADIKQGLNDDLLDDIRMRLMIANGTFHAIAKITIGAAQVPY